MKKNLSIMLWLIAIVLLAGCWNKNPENTETNNQDSSISHTYWTTSLTNEDLEHIEETLPPLSYDYETWDSEAQAIIDSGKYEAKKWEDNKLTIPEYENMVNREVMSSSIEDDMIYTITKITLEDGSVLDVLYVNEPDTLFCRAISIQNGLKSTLYSNFVYDADK